MGFWKRFLPARARAGLVLLLLSTVAHASDPLWNPKVPDFSQLTERLEAPQERSLILSFTGDLMAHRVNFKMNDFRDIYRGVQDLTLGDDLTFVNLETTVDDGRPYSTYPSFNVHRVYVEQAVKAGFDVFSLANNHSNDFGAPAMRATLKTMEELRSAYGVRFSGLRENSGREWEPEIWEKNGIRIGFLAVTNLLNQNTDQELVHFVRYQDLWTGEVHSENRENFFSLIRKYRPRVDLFILGIHDGKEYAHQAEESRSAFFLDCLEAGVDILWGQHPHVLQSWGKVWKNGRWKLLMHSMGNFVSGQTSQLLPRDKASDRARTGDGAFLRVRVVKRGDEVFLDRAEPILLNNFRDETKGVVVGRTEDLALGAPEKWRPFFQKRLQVQNSFLLPWELR